MNILFLATTDPREHSYGGQQRTYVLWKGLKSIGRVWTFVPVPHKRLEEYDDNDRIYKICLEKRYSIGWFLQRIWNKFLPHATVSWGIRFKTHGGYCFYKGLFGVKFDVVVARFLGMAGRLKPWRIAPLYVDVDDTPMTDYCRAYPNNRIRLWILRLWQNHLCKKAKCLWVPDPEQIQELVPFHAEYLPNIPLSDFICRSVEHVRRDTLLFVGYLSHKPNVVAMDWFLNNFWKRLKECIPYLRLNIVGGGLTEDYKSMWRSFDGVKLWGYVEDLTSFWDTSLALITPMIIGSGTCIKVLEALSKGVPVVSTSQGLRGIPVSDRKLDFGMGQFEDFKSLVVVLSRLINCDCLTDISLGAVNYVRSHYRHEVVEQIMQRTLENE